MTPSLEQLEPGHVWLVGAGPGDPGLLTLHAYNALQQADVILHDALIAPEVLDLAHPDTTLEFAGKRSGHHACTQADITSRLVELARQGKRVVRLKGGDPFVFGRGGEEALALAKANIPFRIVPGVTAGLAALAAAGIPATTRETNSAITFATGHFANDGEGSTDWARLATLGHPIVLYMAVQALGTIANTLIENGLSENTSVAVISNATTRQQHVIVTQLAKAHEAAVAAGVKAPAIIVIGEIVRLREKIGMHMTSQASGFDLPLLEKA